MKKFKGYILSVCVAAAICSVLLAGTALANGDATSWRNGLKSHGNIVYDAKDENSEVAIYSSDITALADQIDLNKAEEDTKYTELVSSVIEVKENFANTLTGLGVTTATDATFAEITSNITTLADDKYKAGYSDGERDSGTAIYLGCGAGTYDITQYYNDWQNLTIDNFLINSSAKARVGSDNRTNYPEGGWGTETSCNKSYDANTGVLIIENGEQNDTITSSNKNVQELATMVYAKDVWLVVHPN